MTFQRLALRFPDVELVLTGRMRTALAARGESYAQGVYVSNRVPDAASGGRRDRMVIFRRDGGAASEVLDDARVSARVWATTEQDATDLARLVAALLWAMPNGTPIVSVDTESGPLPIADDSGQPLRYSVYRVRSRGEVLT